jgi:hypothetical protein
MNFKMQNKQNQLIERITNRQLVVGVDIAQQFHVARAVNYRGILVGHPLTFENNDEGFTKFLSWIKELKRINRLDNEYSRWSGYFKREKSGLALLDKNQPYKEVLKYIYS